MRRVLLLAGLALALTSAARAEFVARAKDLHRCIEEGATVRGEKFVIFHKNPKKLARAIRIAESGKPRKRYPEGTIIQVFPDEAMVKRGGGFNPRGGGWEFFLFRLTPEKTRIIGRTADEQDGKLLRNKMGACEDRRCHGNWRAKRFDFICGDRLPWFDISDELFAQLRFDPRCPPPPPAP
jgi:hypothetical protein